MDWRKLFGTMLCVALLLAGARPVQAQSGQCNSSQSAAVQCFVKNAVNTGLATLPPGMTLTQFQAYGVTVSTIVQNPTLVVFLMGMTAAAADALPPTNADATANQAAQDNAVNSIVDAGLNTGLISLPANTNASQLKLLARELTASINQNAGVVISPGALLRVLDSYLTSSTSAGTIDWAQVSTDISTLVDGLVSAGLLKLPANLSASNVKQFAYSMAVAIENYKLATGKATL
jgi:hypothetical protein